MGSIEPVNPGPTVQPVTHIRRNALFTRDSDEGRNEGVIAVAMYLRSRTTDARTPRAASDAAVASDARGYEAEVGTGASSSVAMRPCASSASPEVTSRGRSAPSSTEPSARMARRSISQFSANFLDGVVKAQHEDPHMLDTADTGFLLNTGKQLILVDAGAGAWWGGGAFGRLAGSLRSAGYTPEEVDIVLVTHLHSDHVGGLTTQDGKRVFPNADVYVAKAESDFWLSPEIAAKAPKDAQPFFQSAQAITAPYIKAGKWHTFSGSEPIVDGIQLVPLPGHTPGHTGYEFSSKGEKLLFWGDIVHAQRVQLQHPEVTAIFDIDETGATRLQLLSKLAHEDVLIAGPHTSLFLGLGRLRKEGSGYTWVPVVFTDQWDKR
jgi:glyoxylase-like metal-dependent hydrolase (beta-lactamase superfamily II)